MRTTRGNENFPSGHTEPSTRRGRLRLCWIATYRDVRHALDKLAALLTRRRRAGGITNDAGAPPGDVASISERSEALAILCDRLLEELEGTEVTAAEVRFLVHRPRPGTYPRMDMRSAADLSTGELVLELRRLVAWAAGALGDVAGTLETRAADLGPGGRELLQDEVTALEVDLGVLKAHLADPVDWDIEIDRLLSGEVAPFEDFSADEDADTDD